MSRHITQNLLLSPQLQNATWPPSPTIEISGEGREVITVSGLVLGAKVTRVLGACLKPNARIPRRAPTGASVALLTEQAVDGNGVCTAYNFIWGGESLPDCRIPLAWESDEVRLVTWAYLEGWPARPVIAQSCLKLALGESRIVRSQGGFAHEVSSPQRPAGQPIKAGCSYRNGAIVLDDCIGNQLFPNPQTPAIAVVKAAVSQSPQSATDAPPADATTVMLKEWFGSSQIQYFFRQGGYNGTVRDCRIGNVLRGDTNYLMVWTQQDGSMSWTQLRGGPVRFKCDL